MNYYKKLNLPAAKTSQMTSYASAVNNLILNKASYSPTQTPLYWYLDEDTYTYSYGYKVDDSLDFSTSFYIDFNEITDASIPGIEFISEINIATTAFCLYRHNFPIHRHAVSKNQVILPFILFFSTVEGTLELCSVPSDDFTMPLTSTTYINHYDMNNPHTVTESISVNQNDVYLFDARTWHTFKTTEPVTKDKFTLSFSISATSQDECDQLVSRLESL